MFVPWDCYYMATYSNTGIITIDWAGDTDLFILILYYSYRYLFLNTNLISNRAVTPIIWY
jgi:hypothetical protein